MRANPCYKKYVSEIYVVDDYTDLIPRIPSVPISYRDALPLLQALGGKSAKEIGGDDFVGGLDLDYTVGPSQDVVICMVTDNPEEIQSIPNVVGVIPGSLEPEDNMPVLMGNHCDAWVYGAVDPNSGTAALLEVARGLGKLLQSGWKPLCTIYLLSWSGEEYGLLGSTGWAELNQPLIKRAAVYLNTNTIVSGDMLLISATPGLATVWENTLDDLHTSRQHSLPFANGPRGKILDANVNWEMNCPEMKIMGSGSDFTVFLDHLSIASLDFSFGKSPLYGVYHSTYNSFAWMDAYGGRDSATGSAFDSKSFASKIWGLLALRMANSVLLPIDHIVQGDALLHYTNVICKQTCCFDLSELEKAIKQYQKAANNLHFACNSGMLETKECNEKLGLTERCFLDKDGLPKQPWFKHVLQAPGVYLGYAAEAFAEIQQAINTKDFDLAQQQAQSVLDLIKTVASFLHIDEQTGKIEV